MKKSKTTYKILIFRIIITTLSITLAFAFIYSKVVKDEAIETLTKTDAKKTTQLIFQSLYSAMEKGWNRQDLERIISRLNNIDENMIVRVYRSEDVKKQYGEIKDNTFLLKNNPFVKKAFKNEEVLNISDENFIEYYYPITANSECMRCHNNVKEGDVLGVIDITYPINDLKVSLNSIVNVFILFLILFSAIVFIALFIEFDKHLIKPIKNFVTNLDQISESKDITKRANKEQSIKEIDSMQNVFNQMLDSLEYQFYNDELTKLPNRKRLNERLCEDKNATLFILNIDKFQEINDLYGDKIGDTILVSTALLLKEHFEKNFELFKLHADEYALCSNELLSYENIEALATNITTIIEDKLFKLDSSEIFINATIGIAYGTKNLLGNADIALKLAKRKKVKFLTYESEMNIQYDYEQNLSWSKKIKEAIANDKIVPLFQPIVDTNTKKIVKYEALMRMLDNDGNYIAPIHFLQLAKKNKLYTQLTKIMIEKTLENFKNREENVSINLSVEDILNPKIREFIFDKLKSSKIGSHLIFEIIESEGIENYNDVLSFIKEVKTFGTKISIDDFGTGYSNFEYLMKLNVDYIKIDASMIKNIDKDINARMVTETIVDFAKKMNIKTVAEFIHSKDVYEVVKELKIDFCQGYYFGEPTTLEA